MSHVAVLGLGLLGSGFAEGLLSRGGHSVTVWNRTRAKAEPLAALGATIADTPAEAVRNADRVHLILLDDDTVDTTIAALRGELRAKAVIVDHTTTQPARTAARAAALTAEGIHYLHAPVMMGPGAARSATGMMLVAGPTDQLAVVRDGLAAMTGELWHVGERADLAAAMKLFGNALVLSLVGVVADVMHMADAANVARADALTMLTRLNPAGSIAARGPMMVTGDYTPQFTLDVARKDLRLMLETAGSATVPLLRALADRMAQVQEEGNGAWDVAVVGR